MKWPRRHQRAEHPGIEEARVIRHEARADLAHAEALAARADELLERNHFAEAIERSMRRRFAT
ncbi:Uncharacterised protein [Mycobacteroides abscessus subsp. bolletii]|uniref:Uncharacterized protein n=1 Tax=Mycobacteroides abscessus TaxID=36809 RepID=A0ABD7HIA7_9MYCO|nr:hypothetical protein [Mycobacteroides abscessus]RIT32760.1 hypothetical protein D2E76_23410 [Mycobacteroides abscessus]SHX31072.1 Uncharacterised protein [Mycobacteroides abscessus subsp. bolletii]SKP57519.1 Uncharacterised protein [Mycobacteroides abscessus subsp. bolletii]SKP81486.1 Uncharacterised protein [Mycobacteroides abscessus subsp. bolletii]SKQ37257.1 Uncharacterised protein [Mycobacteroides abscessus subsp. bolletii]